MANGFERYAKKTRRAEFLEEMELVVPWAELVRVGGAALSQGRQWAASSGRGADAADLLFAAVVQLVGPGGGRGLVRFAVDARVRGHRPGSGSLCRTRPRSASSAICWRSTRSARRCWRRSTSICRSKGVRIATGTIVDATIIHAPSSTKNQKQERDPEMHQTRKGQQWYFGMKAHVGVDSKTKLIHSAVATAAHVADSTVLPELLHGEERKVWGDQAYRGQSEAIHEAAPRAQDLTSKRYRYKDRIDEQERERNRTKSRVRSKVEHVFQVMKLKFGFVKVRYRGLKKNAYQMCADLRVGQSVSESSEAADSERVDESRSDGRRRKQRNPMKG